MKTAREFLAAIKEVTANEWDEGAAVFLEQRLDKMRAELDGQRLRGRDREATIAFEWMLLGVQLQLKKTALKAATELAKQGKTPDGKGIIYH